MRWSAALVGVLAVVAFGCGGESTSTDGTDAAATLVRPAVEDLTEQQRADLVGALKRLKQMPSPFEGYRDFSYYDGFVKWHKDAFNCATQTAHVGPNFLPWHRQFLLLLEQALSEAAGKPIAIPYWDWTNPAATTAVFRDDFMGGDGDPEARYAVRSGPFRQGKWKLNVLDQPHDFGTGVPVQRDKRHLVRRIGSMRGIERLPTEASVQRALRVDTYDTVPFDDRADPRQSFRNSLEGWRKQIGERCENGIFIPLTRHGAAPTALHNRVHYWVGGQAGDLPGTMQFNTSPNDPVFWLHHANIDRLWQSWMEVHGEQYLPESGWPRADENADQRMRPYDNVGIDVTPSDMLDIDSLGYSYQEFVALEPPEPGAAPAAGVPEELGFVCRLSRRS